jgi:hypothetical protein
MVLISWWVYPRKQHQQRHYDDAPLRVAIVGATFHLDVSGGCTLEHLQESPTRQHVEYLVEALKKGKVSSRLCRNIPPMKLAMSMVSGTLDGSSGDLFQNVEEAVAFYQAALEESRMRKRPGIMNLAP